MQIFWGSGCQFFIHFHSIPVKYISLPIEQGTYAHFILYWDSEFKTNVSKISLTQDAQFEKTWHELNEAIRILDNFVHVRESSHWQQRQLVSTFGSQIGGVESWVTKNEELSISNHVWELWVTGLPLHRNNVESTGAESLTVYCFVHKKNILSLCPVPFRGLGSFFSE